MGLDYDIDKETPNLTGKTFFITGGMFSVTYHQRRKFLLTTT